MVMSSGETPADFNVLGGWRRTFLHIPQQKHRKAKETVETSLFFFFFSKKESPEVYSVRNIATFGQTEVELTQLVVDGVKLLIAMEKRLQASADIHELLPSHK